MIEVNQYLEIFIEESREHLQNLNESMLNLEQNPEEKSTLNEIFRSAHTLKGMAGSLGFGKMTSLTHKMEDVLDALRNSRMKNSSEIMDVLFKSLDALEDYVGCISENSDEGDSDYSNLVDLLAGIVENNGTAPAGQALEKGAFGSGKEENFTKTENDGKFQLDQYTAEMIKNVKKAGMNSYLIRITLSSSCVLKAARAFIIFRTLEGFSEILKSTPSVEDIEEEKFDLDFEVVIASQIDFDELKSEFDSISEIDKLEIHILETENIIEVKDTVDSESTGEDKVKDLGTGENCVGASNGDQTRQISKPKAAKTVRVDIERLDVLMNLVSELIIIKTRLENTGSAKGTGFRNEELENLEKIIKSLHDAVMKVRMVPIETVFNRFPRMIRDISKDIGKEITLSMSGEETELDRTVIDEIGDPLVHLLRNSADHGIEPAKKRKEMNKPEEGHIFLRAYQDGNNVVIEVEDDGQGIDVEKVRKKIIDKEILSPEVAKSLSQKSLIEYLFKPSFSTTDKITDLSGRGVGLDVVKTKIESLGGSVEVDTQLGKGSKFIIRLPLTLAIIQALLVYVNKEKYAIPLNSVEQIIMIKTDEIKTIQKQEVIIYRNSTIPLIRLNKILDVKDTAGEEQEMTVVIVKKRDRMAGFVISDLIGRQEIVVKPLGKILSGVNAIAGATILGDGNVALILDTNSIA